MGVFSCIRDDRAQTIEIADNSVASMHSTTAKIGETYLGFAPATTDSVNPDVLCLNVTLLGEVHVFHELYPARSQSV
jgi:hypothetical protein